LNLVADAGVERQIVERLRSDGHDVVYIAEVDPSAGDDAVLALSAESAAPLITIDKDFGELVFRQGLAMAGVILVRLEGLSNAAKADAVAAAVREHADRVAACFTVVSPGQVRMRQRL
jgi:predicted nuclease of predicted toxin-antitoxin system